MDGIPVYHLIPRFASIYIRATVLVCPIRVLTPWIWDKEENKIRSQEPCIGQAGQNLRCTDQSRELHQLDWVHLPKSV